MILETSVSVAAGYLAQINQAGQLYEGSNYFQASIAALDYWVRMLRMKIIDAAFKGGKKTDIGRALFICRAVDQPVAEPGDEWMKRKFIEADFKSFGLNFSELSSSAPELPYNGKSDNLVMREIGSVDAYKTFLAKRPTRIDKNLMSLRLADQV